MSTKPLPKLTSDAEAERFVDETDLSQFDLTAFKPHSFEFARKVKQVNVRFPVVCSKRSKPRQRRKG